MGKVDDANPHVKRYSPTSIEVKDCPFCGLEQNWMRSIRMDHGQDRPEKNLYYVFCPRCGATGPPATLSSEAAKLWNGRVTTTDEKPTFVSEPRPEAVRKAPVGPLDKKETLPQREIAVGMEPGEGVATPRVGSEARPLWAALGPVPAPTASKIWPAMFGSGRLTGMSLILAALITRSTLGKSSRWFAVVAGLKWPTRCAPPTVTSPASLRPTTT